MTPSQQTFIETVRKQLFEENIHFSKALNYVLFLVFAEFKIKRMQLYHFLWTKWRLRIYIIRNRQGFSRNKSVSHIVFKQIIER